MTHSQTQGADGAGTKTGEEDALPKAVLAALDRFRVQTISKDVEPRDDDTWAVIDTKTADPMTNWPGELVGEYPTHAEARVGLMKAILAVASGQDRVACRKLCPSCQGARGGMIGESGGSPDWDNCWTCNGEGFVAAPAATPGVPDSVREAFEAAKLQELFVDGDKADVYTKPHGSNFINEFEMVARCSCGELWQKRAVAIARTLNWVGSLISAHPAGQAGDAGAEDGDRSLADLAAHHGRDWAVWWQGSGPERGDHIMELRQGGSDYARELAWIGDQHHDQAGALVAEHNEQMRRLREVIGRQRVAKELLQKEVAELRAPAPDSTRTGAARTEEELLSALKDARDQLHELCRDNPGAAWLTDQLDEGEGLLAGINIVIARAEATIAARPEAPSDAGWRPIAGLDAKQRAVLGRWCRCGDAEDGSEHWYWQRGAGFFFEHEGARHWSLDSGTFEGAPFYGSQPTHFFPVPPPPIPPSDPAPSGQAEGTR